MTFEQTIRAVMGDDYDTCFPARRTVAPDLNEVLTDAEAAFAADLARLYRSASDLGSAEKIRRSLIGALKTIRRDAEARRAKEMALAARGGRLKYRFRATAPDGTELIYPSNGTIRANRRYALLRRSLPTDPAVIRLYVERYYQPYVQHAEETGDAARKEKLLEAIERDLAVEITNDEKRAHEWRTHEWRVWDHGDNLRYWENKRARNEKEDAFFGEGKLPPRYRYEWAVVEGTPFPI